jgi:hypothetical protein
LGCRAANPTSTCRRSVGAAVDGDPLAGDHAGGGEEADECESWWSLVRSGDRMRIAQASPSTSAVLESGRQDLNLRAPGSQLNDFGMMA